MPRGQTRSGGHLLGDKVTPRVARMREAVAGSALFSPFPFHSVYSVEDHKKHVDWIKETNTAPRVGKVSTRLMWTWLPWELLRRAHIVQLDGSYGGPVQRRTLQKEHCHAVEYALPRCISSLAKRASGTESPLSRAADTVGPRHGESHCLGADGVCLGTADSWPSECIRCHHCESGRGCARVLPRRTKNLRTSWSSNGRPSVSSTCI